MKFSRECKKILRPIVQARSAAANCSRKAAEECSPRRQPWVRSGDEEPSPGRGERIPAESVHPA